MAGEVTGGIIPVVGFVGPRPRSGRLGEVGSHPTVIPKRMTLALEMARVMRVWR
jgi:hypothetical protein